MKQRLFVQVLLENKKDLLGGKSETEVASSKLHRFYPKKKKSFTEGSKNTFSFRASLFLSCQNRGISVNLFMLILFDV